MGRWLEMLKKRPDGELTKPTKVETGGLVSFVSDPQEHFLPKFFELASDKVITLLVEHGMPTPDAEYLGATAVIEAMTAAMAAAREQNY